MLSFLYVYSDHSILECYNLFSGVELSMRSFFVILMDIVLLIKLYNKQKLSVHSNGLFLQTFLSTSSGVYISQLIGYA